MGRRKFTAEEAQEIRRLLRRKISAPRSEQKGIRGKLRRIYGFYISDFGGSGFGDGDFDRMVDGGVIRVVEGDELSRETTEHPVVQGSSPDTSGRDQVSHRDEKGTSTTSSHLMAVEVNGKPVSTLADILPDSPGLRVLFVAKTPAPKSVAAGHYFQGRQGAAFWNRLREYSVFSPPIGGYEDDHLLDHGFGITDIVKVPRDYGDEPSTADYKAGLNRILETIDRHQPRVTVFVYKRVLDQILEHGFSRKQKSTYGFNEDLEGLFKSKVFVFPMPGTPCRSEEADVVMTELCQSLDAT